MKAKTTILVAILLVAAVGIGFMLVPTSANAGPSSATTAIQTDNPPVPTYLWEWPNWKWNFSFGPACGGGAGGAALLFGFLTGLVSLTSWSWRSRRRWKSRQKRV